MEIANTIKGKIIETMRETQNTSRLMSGREKVSTQEIAGKALTLRDFEQVTYTDEHTGEVKNYFVVIFDELPGKFYAAGKALSDMCDALEAGGLHSALIENGVLISLELGKTRKGRQFTAVNILE